MTYHTPLTHALRGDHINAVELLLVNGADVNASIRLKSDILYKTSTPLLIYIDNHGNSEEMIKLLLQYGADLHATGYAMSTRRRWYVAATTLEHALYRNNISAIRVMMNDTSSRCDVSKKIKGKSMLYEAADRSYTDMVKLLMTHPTANINGTSDRSETILHRAVYRGDDELVRWLLAQPNIDITKISQYKQSILDKAIMHRRYSIIKMLLAHDPVVSRQMINRTVANRRSKTPSIHLAVEHKDIETLGLLLQYGADINLTTACNNKLTPLHTAVSIRSVKVVKWLIENGANTKQKTGKGLLPIQLVLGNMSSEIVSLLDVDRSL